MEIDNSLGVNDLITRLCEKFTDDPFKIKHLRSNCFGILLGKKTTSSKNKFQDLSTDNPICNLLAWQYVLRHQYKLQEYSNQIIDYHDYLMNCYESENKLDTYHSILKFLLCLRDIPSIQDDQTNLSILPALNETQNFQKLFKLPQSVICRSTSYTDDTFYFKPKKKLSNSDLPTEKLSCGCLDVHQKYSCKQLKSREFKNEFRKETILEKKKEENIWEIAAREKYSKRRTWEAYGHPEPEKEPHFLSELGDLSSLWKDNLCSSYLPKIFKNGIAIRPEIKSRKDFIHDLKYLLVGMASESFSHNDFDELILIPEVSLEGITEDTLEVFCEDFIFSGNCYKALNDMSSPDQYTNKYKCSGYIFAEFCESIKKYLQFYRTAVMSLSNFMNILQFKETTSHLRKQIATLASICWVGPYKKSGEMPHGVALLNYLYKKISELIDEKTILVLYSILFPCCQIYFGRFILQWLLEGSFNDPYEEFFIKTNSKFHSTRGRTYWTRSFTIRHDIIPHFLLDLQHEILLCGKMMNLLKLCHPFSKLCVYLMGKKPQIVSCCITRNQLLRLQQNAEAYFLDATEFCGPKLSLTFILLKDKELNEEFLECISKKRAATLKRIELERQKNVQEEYEKKLEERAMLKEQYDMAVQQKQFEILRDIEGEIRLIETNMQIEKKRDKIMQQEAKDMVEYYEQLFRISDKKMEKTKKRIEILKNCQLNSTKLQRIEGNSDIENANSTKSATIDETNADSDFKNANKAQSLETPASSEVNTIEIEKKTSDLPQKVHSSKSLDEINANLEQLEDTGNNNLKQTTGEISGNNNFRQKLENFESAKRNKLRVMNENLSIEMKETTNNSDVLTAAQKNKLKVMSSEFDIDIKPRRRIDKELSIADINKFRVMSSSVFAVDTEKVNNKNIEENHSKTSQNQVSKLNLNLNFKEKPSETEKHLPMSIDSTPLSDIVSSSSVSKVLHGDDRLNLISGSTTANTEKTDDGGFDFTRNYEVPEEPASILHRNVFSKTCSLEDLRNLKPMCLKMFLSKSLSYSLIVQTKLVSSELLRYFVENLKYLQHLNNLQRYFLLQDGEFARTITETLFQKLYKVKLPIELINCRVLNYIIHGALEDTKRAEGIDKLSFKILNLPESFNLGDIEVLNCLSLTYKIEWPLNILLPSDTIGKYNEIFKFLLKIYRMQWILKNVFMDLRMLAKEAGEKEHAVVISDHYRRIHQFRHVMVHFIQTLQSYITGEVFQTHWANLEAALKNVTNLDELYNAHTQYLKNILFMCFLNQRSVPLRKVFEKIFTVILKFYDHLRSKRWEYKNGTFSHSSFNKLEAIFQNFLDLVRYLFKVGRKVVKNGYQPHFRYFLDYLNTNDYYSKILD